MPSEKIVQVSREKKQENQETRVRMAVHISAETLEAKGNEAMLSNF